jgi:hypothetical protein
MSVCVFHLVISGMGGEMKLRMFWCFE